MKRAVFLFRDREAIRKQMEMEKSLTSGENEAELRSNLLKGSETEMSRLQRCNADLLAQKKVLEHKASQLERNCQKLKERLREKLVKDEKKGMLEKEAFKRLRLQTASLNGPFQSSFVSSKA